MLFRSEENDRIWGKKVVVDAGDSQNMQPGQIVTARKLRDENSMLKRRDLKPVEVRDAVPLRENFPSQIHEAQSTRIQLTIPKTRAKKGHWYPLPKQL